MIQRIQSVYLLIAACIQIAVFFLVWSSYFVDDQSFFLTGLESSVGSISAMPLTLSIAVSIALMLATLISFKNRASQMRLANIVMLQLLLVFGIFGFAHYQIIQTIKESFGQVEIGYGLAVATPFISMILIWLAKKAIKKDDDLVKSVDRLRWSRPKLYDSQILKAAFSCGNANERAHFMKPVPASGTWIDVYHMK